MSPPWVPVSAMSPAPFHLAFVSVESFYSLLSDALPFSRVLYQVSVCMFKGQTANTSTTLTCLRWEKQIPHLERWIDVCEDPGSLWLGDRENRKREGERACVYVCMCVCVCVYVRAAANRVGGKERGRDGVGEGTVRSVVTRVFRDPKGAYIQTRVKNSSVPRAAFSFAQLLEAQQRGLL